jgi:hypothetical protein
VLAEPAELWVGEPQPPRFYGQVMICSSDAFTNIVFKNPTKIAVCFDLLKTDFLLRAEIYRQSSTYIVT